MPNWAAQKYAIENCEIEMKPIPNCVIEMNPIPNWAIVINPTPENPMAMIPLAEKPTEIRGMPFMLVFEFHAMAYLIKKIMNNQ